MKNIFKKYFEYVAERHEEVMEQYLGAAEKSFSCKMTYGSQNKKNVPFKVREDA